MHILILRSSFQTDEFVKTEYAELMALLHSECHAEIEILGNDEASLQEWNRHIKRPDFLMIATGGVENLFVSISYVFENTVRLIADGRNNSLAAALEILSFLNSHGKKGKVIHGTNAEIVETVKIEVPIFDNTRIGLFGKPSDWLIDSHVDYNTLDRYDMDIVHISLERLAEAIKHADENEALQLARECAQRAKQIVEPSDADMLLSAKTYLAIRKICKEEGITAMTIRCFDIIKSCGTTSCLALALLNDDGIVAGCEGDLQSLVTMILAQRLCGEKAFMANPSILTDKTSLLAHCTLPLSMCDEISIRSHFESMSGVAIQGLMPLTDYTIVKWGGKNLDKFHVAEAKAIEYAYSSHFCRTQIMLDVNLKPYLLNHTIGNHQIIIKGHHADKIRQFMTENGVEEIG